MERLVSPGDLRSSTPTGIRKQGVTHLEMTWQDGHVSLYPAPFLRGSCPCASCVDEISGERRFGQSDVAAEVGFVSLKLVGNYAVRIRFSDGHDTGLYTWAYLRSLARALDEEEDS